MSERLEIENEGAAGRPTRTKPNGLDRKGHERLYALAQRLGAEFLGTALLLATVVGSGIMGWRLSAGNAAVTLLANSLATGLILACLIGIFGPISGAHFNPVVTLAGASLKITAWRTVPWYLVAQLAGAFVGVALAHGMFDERILQVSTRERSGLGQFLSEGVATFGLLLTIWSFARHRPKAVGLAVGAYIAGAYWFTASTSFANPAVTLARSMTATFAGIRPADVSAFILAQFLGAAGALAAIQWLLPPSQAPSNGEALKDSEEDV